MASIHNIVPPYKMWYFMFIPYWGEWRTFIWQVMMLGVIILGSSAVIMSLPRTVSWMIILILSEMLFIQLWYMLRLIDDFNEMRDHNNIYIIGTSVAIVATVVLIRQLRRPTWQEKHAEIEKKHDEVEKKNRELVGKIQSINRRDIPELFERFMNIKLAASSMKEHHFIDRWQKILIEEAENGDKHLSEAYAELTKLTEADKN